MKTTARVLGVAAVVLVLSGCGASSPTVLNPPDTAEETAEKAAEQEADREAKEEYWTERITPVTKTLPNGDEVPCLVLHNYDHVDLECDFAAPVSTQE